MSLKLPTSKIPQHLDLIWPTLGFTAVTLLTAADRLVGLVALLFVAVGGLFLHLRQGSERGVVAKDAGEVVSSPADVLRLIKKRRSVFPKDYNGQEAPKEVVQSLLEAANWAPTHGKTEPWRFVVLGRQGISEMIDTTIQILQTRLPADEFQETKKSMEKKREQRWVKASHMIAICMKRQALPEKLLPEWEEMCACACAVQNMYLLSTAYGIASYWSSWNKVARDTEEMKSFLDIGPEDRCLGFFVLGCSDRIESYRGSRGPVAEKVVWRN